MTRDSKDNRRGCFIVGAVVAALVAALAWGIASTDDDPRANAAGAVKGAAAPVDPAN